MESDVPPTPLSVAEVFSTIVLCSVVRNPIGCPRTHVARGAMAGAD
jgi:hypothetical protein